MSHRAYLYNLNTPSIADDGDIMVMEWKYEVPLMLQPLLISGGFISGNNYNNHIAFNDSGLYYEAKPGIENMKQFYDFLESQPGVIHHIDDFEVSRDKMFKYLDGLAGKYFHLDLWDIFNMTDAPHSEQAEEWLAGIAHNNLIISNAINRGNIDLLDYNKLVNVSPAFSSFVDLLNYDGYAFGWACIDVPFEHEQDYEIFQENELWGLKTKEGRVLHSPVFTEFFNFDLQDLAVVSKNGKYGYVNTSGNIVIPLIWDDAFDFEYSNVAVVESAGKMGLIDISGKQLTEFKYDELGALGDGDYFSANIDGLWGVIDKCGHVMINFEHSNEIQAGYGFYHIELNGQKSQQIFNAYFRYLGEFPLRAVENLEYGRLLVKPHRGMKSYSIYQKEGILLGSGFDHVESRLFDDDLLFAFKAEEVFTVSETEIHPASKERALKYAGVDYTYDLDYECRKRLFIFGNTQKMTDREIESELTATDTLYERAESAYDNEDYGGAIHYFSMAAEKGYAPAMNNLAHIYYSQDEFVDDEQAFHWYHQGALAANVDAMNGLGICYKFGVGCAPDLEKAIHWLSNAAEAQYALAYNNLGDLYSDEAQPIFDVDQALEYYHKSADLGQPKYNWLGYLYDVKGNYKKAFQYYLLATNDGNAVSAYNLGVLYLRGLGTTKSVEKAIESFQIALDCSYPEAHLELAGIYRNEIGFKDSKKAEVHIDAARVAELEIPDELMARKKGWFEF